MKEETCNTVVFKFACSEFFLIVSRQIADASDDTRPSAAIGSRFERAK
jgi:hypothetical protein